MPTTEEIQTFDLILHGVELFLAVGIFFFTLLIAWKVRELQGPSLPPSRPPEDEGEL